MDNRVVKVLEMVANIRDFKLGREGLQSLFGIEIGRQSDQAHFLFSVLCVCGDRSLVPLTLLKNMPGESILLWLSAKTTWETAGDNSGFVPLLNSWCSEGGRQLSGCVLSHSFTASTSAAPAPTLRHRSEEASKGGQSYSCTYWRKNALGM